MTITPQDWEQISRDADAHGFLMVLKVKAQLVDGAGDGVEAVSRRLALPSLVALVAQDEGYDQSAVDLACHVLLTVCSNQWGGAPMWHLLSRAVVQAGVLEALTARVYRRRAADAAAGPGAAAPSGGGGWVHAALPQLLCMAFLFQGAISAGLGRERGGAALASTARLFQALVDAPQAGDRDGGGGGGDRFPERLLRRLPGGGRWEDAPPSALLTDAGGSPLMQLCEVVSAAAEWRMLSDAAVAARDAACTTLAGCLQLAGVFAHVGPPPDAPNLWMSLLMAMHDVERLLTWALSDLAATRAALGRPDVLRALPVLMRLAPKALAPDARGRSSDFANVPLPFRYVPASLAARWVGVYMDEGGWTSRPDDRLPFLRGLATAVEGTAARIAAAFPGQDGVPTKGPLSLLPCKVAGSTHAALEALLRGSDGGGVGGAAAASSSGRSGRSGSGNGSGSGSGSGSGIRAGRATTAAAEPTTAAAAAQPQACRTCGVTNAQLRQRGEPPEVKLRRCVACRGVAYCGAACQRSDWRRHRQECAQAK